ncbi:hypothetical protein L7F22_013544 [Adiantum nelumboides]|nr:hypothetical protein [Adiantum nelumboides]
MIIVGFQGMLRYWWDDVNEASKTIILQGGIPESFENVITLFFAAMVIQFLGSRQKIKDKYKEAFFRGLQIDDQITLAQRNAFIDEVTDLECARLRMKKEFKQVKGFSSSFCNKETKSKDFGCAAAKKKCSCKVKDRRNKYGSEDSEPSWMKKRRPSTLNLSKKEQRDYRPLPLLSNMVEQAKEIAKTEEWRRMIHPDVRQNQGNPPSPVIQQNASTDFAIPKTEAKPSPSVVEKQLEKERQDRYCVVEHQLKAIQATFSALEQVNNRIEQLHKLVLNTQSQSAAIEAKVDQCHKELQYLIDKAAVSKITKEPVSEWKLQRPVNTCQNGVTVFTKEQVAEKELKYSEPYILPPANAKLQPMESASNWHTNALKEIAKLQYSIISRIDAMVKAKQSVTPSTSAAPPSTASQQLVPLNYNTSASRSILPHDLEDAFNPSLRWGI